MKIAIFSDIHGNLEALQSIVESWDELWVLGDLVNYGPNPVEVVDFVRRNAALAVRGNHDHAVGAAEDPRCSAAFREMAQAMKGYTESLLSDDQKAYLRRLPITAQRAVGGQRYFLCHAVPSDPLYRYCPADPALWKPEAAAANADVVLAGHTHLPFVMNLGARRVVNPGSVGQPKHGAPEACYAIWEDGVLSLRSCRYPVEKTVRKVLGLPLDLRIRRQLADVLATGLSPGDLARRCDYGIQ
ncbi:MAG: metallophosphoesterase family protein [Acidobacteria bacterium]|nr:metallophosphoesterase family protein [Acidobacteriota bacterium]